MNWTRIDGAKAAFDKRWARGDLLRVALGNETRSLLRLALRGPTTQDLADRFTDVRMWVEEWRAMAFGRLEWVEKRDRVIGTQRLPAALCFDDIDALAAWLGYEREVGIVRHLAELARQRRPAILAWLTQRPFQAIELADAWIRLLDVADWMDAHPRSGLYARQVDVAGVHSKFIERHLGVLREWLSTGPTARVDADLGLQAKPLRLRFRILDRALKTLPGTSCPDIEIDAVNFARFELPVAEVFITENEVNFLAFPERPRSMVIFGAGYGWSALAQARWLDRCHLYYWGDIDTHGFVILDGLRASFPHAESFLMDRRTLMDHLAAWGVEGEPSRRDLERLRPDEASLYDDLRFRRLVDPELAVPTQVRLEQERVAYGYLAKALLNLRF